MLQLKRCSGIYGIYIYQIYIYEEKIPVRNCLIPPEFAIQVLFLLP